MISKEILSCFTLHRGCRVQCSTLPCSAVLGTKDTMPCHWCHCSAVLTIQTLCPWSCLHSTALLTYAAMQSKLSSKAGRRGLHTVRLIPCSIRGSIYRSLYPGTQLLLHRWPPNEPIVNEHHLRIALCSWTYDAQATLTLLPVALLGMGVCLPC